MKTPPLSDKRLQEIVAGEGKAMAAEGKAMAAELLRSRPVVTKAHQLGGAIRRAEASETEEAGTPYDELVGEMEIELLQVLRDQGYGT